MRELPTPTLPFASLPLDTARRHLPRAAETVTSEYRLRAAWARTEDE
ncbi:MAG: GNAT family N-acetyltransferase, partial [Burkholderia vietnamiensis]|nr:GNAT family N-acetyltransferase [Burkholderia vietnamiensis]